jgi:hypothetical protein
MMTMSYSGFGSGLRQACAQPLWRRNPSFTMDHAE